MLLKYDKSKEFVNFILIKMIFNQSKLTESLFSLAKGKQLLYFV